MTDTLHALRPERVPGVPLSRLAPGSPEVPVTGVTLDSRTVLPGDLYVALPGAHVHGAQFVDA
ncbi:MAG TPA: UDP-N-acetylmuramoyl-L-alanyl-D-glutamate--2,6-diaminopimelate ligase, partial [Propionibacteriaceae bacterium]|nr:UDP-N-acetylmuramoyl-L-alanyl-D-glutamate--2,6-diaminopimelate ligase [Propionibacteriaceae bacterium]